MVLRNCLELCELDERDAGLLVKELPFAGIMSECDLVLAIR